MNEIKTLKSRNLILFVIITFAWSWLLWLPQVLDTFGFEISPILLFLGNLAVFGPTLSSILITGATLGKNGIKSLLKKGINYHFRRIWWLPILLIGPIISFLSLLVVLIIEGPAVLSYSLPFTMFFPVLVIIFLTGGPLAEEFGWRGYLLERVQHRWNALVSALLIGIIWAIWHLPLHFIAGTTQQVIPIYQDLIIITISSIIYTWIYNNTQGSVLATMILHTANNVSATLFPYWISDLGRWMSFFLNLLVIVIIILIYHPKRMVKNTSLN